jgi:hypothetical protein
MIIPHTMAGNVIKEPGTETRNSRDVSGIYVIKTAQEQRCDRNQ